MSKARRALPSRSDESPEVKPADFFVLRAPVRPFSDFLSLGEGLLAPKAKDDKARLSAALQEDRARLRARLRERLARPEIREALFIASPRLEESLPLWEKDPESERGQKVERALMRYLQRMCVRPTPFGLFARCALGKVGDTTRFLLGPQKNLRRYTRLDMHYLSALTEALEAERSLQEGLRFRPNSSLYTAVGQLRYVEWRTQDAERGRSYHLVSVEPAEYLLETLARARKGATIRELSEALVSEEITEEEALEYIHTLIENQILVSSLEPAVTGPDPLDALCESLAHLAEKTPAAGLLPEVRCALRQFDQEGLGISPARYHKVAEALQTLPAPVDISRLFQVDLADGGPSGAVLGGEVLKEIQRGIALLARLAIPRQEEPIERFRQRFLQRYEEREVPLTEALDEESGIGFDGPGDALDDASPLLEGLAFPAPQSDEALSFRARDALLLKRLFSLAREGARELPLDDALLSALKQPAPAPLPDSFAVLGALYTASEERLREGEFQVYLQGVSGPSGASLLGRFCHLDPDLRRAVEAYLRAEEALQPDAVFAEIVHLPQGRLGNILYRPCLRPYEIPFLARAGVPPEGEIPVSDLWVCVRGGRVVLRSRRLGREVIPRMTNAHNFSGADLGLYRFLCALQYQGLGSISWQWGALESLPFLPRVTYGRLILSFARWLLEKEDIAPLISARGEERFLAAQALRERLSLPRLVALVDFDNLLPVDFDNVLSVEAFVSLLSQREQVFLRELLPDPDLLFAASPEGRFTHEFVLPFLRQPKESSQKSERRPPPKEATRQAPPSRRSFPPGAEWTYLKLYTGPATADRVLREGVRPLVEKALSSSRIQRWFFIRYSDPDWHLRLRFAGEPGALAEIILPALEETLQPLWEEKLLWKVQFDTYEREVERYGGDEGVLLSEELFFADSEAALSIVERLSPEEGAEARWRLTLLGIDMLLDDFGFSLSEKRDILGGLRVGFTEEFGRDAAFEKQLDLRYRALRPELTALLRLRPDEEHPLSPGKLLLGERSLRWAPAIAALKEAEKSGRLTRSLSDLAQSHIHMHANRMLRSAARAQERVIYDFLHRLYDSALARKQATARE